MGQHELHRTIRDEIMRRLSPWLVDVACTRNRCEYSFVGESSDVVIGHEFCTHAWIEVNEMWRHDDAEDTDEAHLELVLELIGCAEVILADSELSFPEKTQERWAPQGQGLILERRSSTKEGLFERPFSGVVITDVGVGDAGKEKGDARSTRWKCN